MRKSIKILVCILIVVIISPIGSYAYQYDWPVRPYEDNPETIKIYCEEREGEEPPRGVTLDVINNWYNILMTKLGAGESSRARSILNDDWKPIVQRRQEMESWGESEITDYFDENRNEDNYGLDDISTGILQRWLDAMRNVTVHTGIFPPAFMRDAIEEEIESRSRVNPSASNTWTDIVNYFYQNDSNPNNYEIEEINLGDISTPVLVAWYNTSTNNSDARSEPILNAIMEELENRNIVINPETFEGFQDTSTESGLEYWSPINTGSNDKLITKAQKILGVIQVFGSVASVIALALIGIKYMLGSVAEKAKYKEVMIPYIVGCVMLFAITNLVSVIYKVATNLQA